MKIKTLGKHICNEKKSLGYGFGLMMSSVNEDTTFCQLSYDFSIFVFTDFTNTHILNNLPIDTFINVTPTINII